MKAKQTAVDIPKAIYEDTLKLGDLTLKVCVLDNGQRVIPKEEMTKVLDYLGITKDELKGIGIAFD